MNPLNSSSIPAKIPSQWPATGTAAKGPLSGSEQLQGEISPHAKTPTSPDPAAAARKGLIADATKYTDTLKDRIAKLSDGPASSAIKNNATALLGAIDQLSTLSADNPSALSVDDLYQMREQMAALQMTATAMKSANKFTKLAETQQNSKNNEAEILREALPLTKALKTALRGAIREATQAADHAAKTINSVDAAALKSQLESHLKDVSNSEAGAGKVLQVLVNWESIHFANIQEGLKFLPEAMVVSEKSVGLLRNKYETVRDAYLDVKVCIENLKKIESIRNDPTLATNLDGFLKKMQEGMCGLQSVLEVIKEYRSPSSVENICAAKIVEVDAALSVLRDAQKGQAPPTDRDNLIDALQRRRDALLSMQKMPEDTEAKRLLGKPALSGWSRLLRPFDAIRQQLQLDKTVGRITANPKLIFDKSTLATEYFTEKQLLSRLLQKAGITNPNKQLSAAIGKVLDQRAWNTITSKIVVPVAIDDSKDENPVKTITTTSVVTPAGKVLNDKNRIQFLSDESPINSTTVKAYQHRQSDGKAISGGFNSHDTTEVTHAVMAAHTELSMNGKVLLGATRTGVNAPYGLDGDHLRQQPSGEAAALIGALVGKASVGVTRVKINADAENTDDNSEAAQTADMSQTGNDKNQLPANTISTKFKVKANQALEKIQGVVNGLVEAGLMSTSVAEQDEAALSRPSPTTLADLLKPGRETDLVNFVAAEPELVALLRQQASLNRVREAFLLEMTRSPEFAKKIAAGEKISFMSLSLLTPDAFRASLSSLIPELMNFDEKTMIELQVQAWADLQQEINAGGIVVNGQTVKADIVAFNFGVNAPAVGDIARNPVLGEAVSGTAFANQLTNSIAMEKIIGPTFAGTRTGADTEDNAVSRYLDRQISELSRLEADNASGKNHAEIDRIAKDVQTVVDLRAQISEIWLTGSYMIAGNEPYKLVSRLLVLNHLIGGGSQFNCKSGKDRTGQLDVEAKFLAFQIERNGGTVPLPDRTRNKLERLQFAAFVFQDEARRTMQAYATGYGGSKLAGMPSLYRNFLMDLEGYKDSAKRMIAEFLGLAHFTQA